MKKFDAIIIGTGQAGSPLALKLAGEGLKVAIIEKGAVGGTCVNTGCTPTKAYVASARRAYIAKKSSDMGIEIDGNVRVNLKTIKARKDKLVSDSLKGLTKALEEMEGVTLIKGEARFSANHRIEVNGEILEAKKIFINSGSRPRIPEEFTNVPYLTNATILELEKIPEHLIIVGGGYIGLEFSQMFRRFGSKVSIIEKGSKLLSKEDEDIGSAVEEILTSEGISLELNSECISVKETGKNKIEATLQCGSNQKSITGTHLLMAVGRLPNTDNLGLENTDIKTNKKGFIEVNGKLETSVKNVWALGDCNGEGAFTHTAYNDYEIIAANFFSDKNRSVADRYPCYAAYIDPPFARVGMNYAEIKEKNIKAKVAIKPLSNIARAKEMGETKGLLKIYVDTKSNEFLGASFLGAGADEYIHLIIDAMYGKVPFATIRDSVHIHPTVSELIPTMLEDLEDI